MSNSAMAVAMKVTEKNTTIGLIHAEFAFANPPSRKNNSEAARRNPVTKSSYPTVCRTQ